MFQEISRTKFFALRFKINRAIRLNKSNKSGGMAMPTPISMFEKLRDEFVRYYDTPYRLVLRI